MPTIEEDFNNLFVGTTPLIEVMPDDPPIVKAVKMGENKKRKAKNVALLERIKKFSGSSNFVVPDGSLNVYS